MYNNNKTLQHQSQANDGTVMLSYLIQESPADAVKPARRKTCKNCTE